MTGSRGDERVSGGWLSPFLERQRIRHVLRYIPSNVDILDIGCGRANILASLPPLKRYVGVDVLQEVVDNNNKCFPEQSFFCVNIERDGLPIVTTFDVIIMLAVLEHLIDPLAMVKNLKKYLAERGKIVLTTPHPCAELPHRAGATVGIFSREAAKENNIFFDRSMLADLSRQAGLVITDYKRFQFGLNQVAVLQH
ncbi:MAG TPA: class I SAM-dependent methyltransferase, partial [Bacteroidota bacterium]|nr:class I SAM-dependent methyltransferase [Bacteroidota bacterium]